MRHAAGRLLLLTVALLLLSTSQGWAQANSIGFFGGLTLPMLGDITPEVGYKDLYGNGLTFGAQYRYLVGAHLSIVGEFARTKLGADPEALMQIIEVGALEAEGGDMVRLRFSGGGGSMGAGERSRRRRARARREEQRTRVVNEARDCCGGDQGLVSRIQAG